ncbi:MAG: hypothetical protein IKK34_06795 [Clostridia bacterium]|nr:hypothetical protein [Clostridia bacterium]
MAIAKVDITCKDCGCTFTHRKSCHSRPEADDYERWASRNITICPECNHKHRVAAMVDTLKQHGFALPELTGVSDKQIAYAQSVRERYLLDNLNRVDKYRRFQGRLNDAEQMAQLAQVCTEQGTTVEDAINEYKRSMGFDTMQIMLTSANAGEILDAHAHH